MNSKSLLFCSIALWACFSSAANAANWTGYYVGGQIGYATGTTAALDNNGTPSTDIDYDGFLGGVTFGYNHNINKFIIGAEGDYSFASVSGSGDGGPGWGCGTPDVCTFEVKQLATVRVRFGYDFGNILPYATAGIAYGKTSGELGGCPTGWCGEDTQTGSVYGVGAEFAINAKLSAKVELLHVDLGTSTFGPGNGGAGFQADFNFNTVRAGVNYRF